jgi:hypothetical protein
MSHTTRAGQGTLFIYNGDYSGDVTIHAPDGQGETEVPFADLRELIFGYLRAQRIERAEQASDDEFEKDLL